MKICNLASSSSGNCTYIETSKYKILIDIGKTKKYIIEKLKDIGVSYKDIDYVFLTHTHDDHTAALNTFLDNHKASLVITNGMAKQLKYLDDINVITYEENPIIDGLNISTYRMSHDAGDTRAFVIEENNRSLVYITDTGYINSKYLPVFSNKTCYFIESNHDIELLQHGPYPEWLKKRVLSDVGHLSNKFCGIYLSKMIGENTKVIGLLHLSDKNNDPNVAIDTVNKYISDYNVDLFYTEKNNHSKVIEI